MFVAFKTVYQQSWWQTIGKVSAIYLIYFSVLGVIFDEVMNNIF
jgi:hypothetical protein